MHGRRHPANPLSPRLPVVLPAVVLLAVMPLLLAGDLGRGRAAADEPAPLPLDFRSRLAWRGEASLEGVTQVGRQDFLLRLEVTNPSDVPIEILSANLLLASEDGWLTPLDPEPMDGTFLKGKLPVLPGVTRLIVQTDYHPVAPAAAAVFTARADDGHAEVVVPIVSRGNAAPTPREAPYPFGVGLAGPLEAVPFSDGSRSFLLLGQYQCLGGATPTRVRTSAVVSDGGGVLAPIEWDGMGEQGDRSHLWPFVRRMDVPESFRGGTVRVKATAMLGTQPASFEGDWKVRVATPVEMKGPVLGAWQLTNGPGQRILHAHYRSPEQRWSYDFVVVEQGATFRGEPHKNSSYFAWGRTVRAAADGLVVDACDREPDNPALGATGNVLRPVSPCHVNRVVLKHDDGTFTVYFHLRQRSVAPGVLPGQRVRAGQGIAQVGNSGSSEPHLHFLAYRLDTTGRPTAVPVAFTNAFEDSAATRRIVGVPVGGTAAHFVGPE